MRITEKDIQTRIKEVGENDKVSRKHFGEALESIREHYGIQIEELCLGVGIDKDLYFVWTRGEFMPDCLQLRRLALYLGARTRLGISALFILLAISPEVLNRLEEYSDEGDEEDILIESYPKGGIVN